MQNTARLITHDAAAKLQSEVLVPRLLVSRAGFKLVSAIKVLNEAGRST